MKELQMTDWRSELLTAEYDVKKKMPNFTTYFKGEYH